MKVYHYFESGLLAGESDAHPDPLELEIARRDDPAAQPSVWLLPAQATFQAPPTAPKGKRARFVDGAWAIEPIPAEAPAETPAPSDPLVEQKAAALAGLEVSDRVAIRCFKAGVPFPAEWEAYVQSLRALIREQAQVAQLPAQPAFPAES